MKPKDKRAASRPVALIALVLALSAGLPGCGGSTPVMTAAAPGIFSAAPAYTQTGGAASPSPTARVAAEGPLAFSARYIRVSWSSETDYPVVTLIRSKEELEKYCYQARSQYDESYFKDNVLIDVLLGTGSGSCRFKVAGVYAVKGDVEIAIACLIPAIGTDDMAAWHMLIEVGRAGLPDGNINVSTYAASMSGETDYSKLWSVSLAKNGYTRSAASHAVSWQGGDVRMELSIQPEAFALNPPAGMKTVFLHGREYQVYETAYFVDGPGISGTSRQNGIVWASGGLFYLFYAETINKGASLDAVSPETAEKLEATPGMRFEGFTIGSDTWRVEYAKGHIVVNASLAQYDTIGRTIERDLKDGGYEPVSEGGMTYYARKIKDSMGRIISSSISWRSNIGVFSLSAGVPRDYLKEAPPGTFDFINADLIKSITEQMGGGKVIPFVSVVTY